jgi:hypothetical protein
MPRIKQKWCKCCGRYVGAVQNEGARLGLGDWFLALLTGGLWLLIRFLAAFGATLFTIFRSKWVCPNCGSRV